MTYNFFMETTYQDKIEVNNEQINDKALNRQTLRPDLAWTQVQ